MQRIWYFIRSFKRLKTVNKATQMGLKHRTNIFGDAIIGHGYARSIWIDKYNNNYLCNELLQKGRDEVIESLQKKYPNLFL